MDLIGKTDLGFIIIPEKRNGVYHPLKKTGQNEKKNTYFFEYTSNRSFSIFS
jgi:hypothetical protein